MATIFASFMDHQQMTATKMQFMARNQLIKLSGTQWHTVSIDIGSWAQGGSRCFD